MTASRSRKRSTAKPKERLDAMPADALVDRIGVLRDELNEMCDRLYRNTDDIVVKMEVSVPDEESGNAPILDLAIIKTLLLKR